jgi:hypothetical protein
VSDVWTSDEYLDLVAMASLMDDMKDAGAAREVAGEDEVSW